MEWAVDVAISSLNQSPIWQRTIRKQDSTSMAWERCSKILTPLKSYPDAILPSTFLHHPRTMFQNASFSRFSLCFLIQAVATVIINFTFFFVDFLPVMVKLVIFRI